MRCPSCQTDNPNGAHFCFRCGALMPTDAPESDDSSYQCPHCRTVYNGNVNACGRCGVTLLSNDKQPANRRKGSGSDGDALIGQTVGGRYTIRRLLGMGGMGVVYEAFRHLVGVEQRVAVKTLHKHLSNDDRIWARFHRECGTAMQLKHPNTIRVEDFGQAPTGELYLAMEFVDGRSIARELQPNGPDLPARPIDPARVERILEQVCSSLAEAHQQGIVHRDLKPENVMLLDVGGDRDFVKVLDFGIAVLQYGDATREQKLAQQGMVIGTPPYMSPEQFTGKLLDTRSDVYSLAIMAYKMLTGRLPFEAETPWEWATKHMTEAPRPFEQWPAGAAVPPRMRQAIMRALAKRPDQRPPGVVEFCDAAGMTPPPPAGSREIASNLRVRVEAGALFAPTDGANSPRGGRPSGGFGA